VEGRRNQKRGRAGIEKKKGRGMSGKRKRSRSEVLIRKSVKKKEENKREKEG